jgi:hypothetical protein
MEKLASVWLRSTDLAEIPEYVRVESEGILKAANTQRFIALSVLIIKPIGCKLATSLVELADAKRGLSNCLSSQRSRSCIHEFHETAMAR